MPTYQYACTECVHEFEQVQSFSENTLTECPECQGRLRKLFGAVGVVFKGSGFYRNDSRATTNGSESAGSNGSSDSSSKDSAKDTSSGSSSPKESAAPAPAKESSTKTAKASSDS